MPRGMSARPSAQHSAVRKDARVEVRTDKDLVRDLQVARRTDRVLEREPPRTRNPRGEREELRAPNPAAPRLEARNPPKIADQVTFRPVQARVEDVSEREPSLTGIRRRGSQGQAGRGLGAVAVAANLSPVRCRPEVGGASRFSADLGRSQGAGRGKSKG